MAIKKMPAEGLTSSGQSVVNQDGSLENKSNSPELSTGSTKLSASSVSSSFDDHSGSCRSRRNRESVPDGDTLLSLNLRLGVTDRTCFTSLRSSFFNHPPDTDSLQQQYLSDSHLSGFVAVNSKPKTVEVLIPRLTNSEDSLQSAESLLYKSSLPSSDRQGLVGPALSTVGSDERAQQQPARRRNLGYSPRENSKTHEVRSGRGSEYGFDPIPEKTAAARIPLEPPSRDAAPHLPQLKRVSAKLLKDNLSSLAKPMANLLQIGSRQPSTASSSTSPEARADLPSWGSFSPQAGSSPGPREGSGFVRRDSGIGSENDVGTSQGIAGLGASASSFPHKGELSHSGSLGGSSSSSASASETSGVIANTVTSSSMGTNNKSSATASFVGNSNSNNNNSVNSNSPGFHRLSTFRSKGDSRSPKASTRFSVAGGSGGEGGVGVGAGSLGGGGSPPSFDAPMRFPDVDLSSDASEVLSAAGRPRRPERVNTQGSLVRFSAVLGWVDEEAIQAARGAAAEQRQTAGGVGAGAPASPAFPAAMRLSETGVGMGTPPPPVSSASGSTFSAQLSTVSGSGFGMGIGSISNSRNATTCPLGDPLSSKSPTASAGNRSDGSYSRSSLGQVSARSPPLRVGSLTKEFTGTGSTSSGSLSSPGGPASPLFPRGLAPSLGPPAEPAVFHFASVGSAMTGAGSSLSLASRLTCDAVVAIDGAFEGSSRSFARSRSSASSSFRLSSTGGMSAGGPGGAASSNAAMSLGQIEAVTVLPFRNEGVGYSSLPVIFPPVLPPDRSVVRENPAGAVGDRSTHLGPGGTSPPPRGLASPGTSPSGTSSLHAGELGTSLPLIYHSPYADLRGVSRSAVQMLRPSSMPLQIRPPMSSPGNVATADLSVIVDLGLLQRVSGSGNAAFAPARPESPPPLQVESPMQMFVQSLATNQPQPPLDPSVRVGGRPVPRRLQLGDGGAGGKVGAGHRAGGSNEHSAQSTLSGFGDGEEKVGGQTTGGVSASTLSPQGRPNAQEPGVMTELFRNGARPLLQPLMYGSSNRASLSGGSSSTTPSAWIPEQQQQLDPRSKGSKRNEVGRVGRLEGRPIVVPPWPDAAADGNSSGSSNDSDDDNGNGNGLIDYGSSVSFARARQGLSLEELQIVV